ncbi:PspC domain-containing protein [Streptomyces sp. PTM05]|uniref:PspC domain-containing protein n=1 Tax=Streptantibioticus parmotrematis TaxID=2873249 RepID=A0ABS7QPZ4_9ACTN|nr:PspC domain-containing protein [Streptantibioticus parmotrematis]MBY8883874.1 PspC domain-containing protein [Streptantibioticus parmotrematis]
MTDHTTGEAASPDASGPGRDAGPPRRLLTRSRRPKVLGGVCGGLGRYFGIDPVVFRVVIAVLALTGGIGLISYGIGWLLIPMDGEDETELRRLLSGRLEGGSLTAVLCTLVGSGLFLSTIDNGDNQGFSLCLAAATVGAVYWSYRRRTMPAAGQGDAEGSVAGGAAQVADAPPAAQPPPTATPSWWRTTSAGTVSFDKSDAYGPAGGGSDGRGTRYLWGPEEGPGAGSSAYESTYESVYEKERDGDADRPTAGRPRRSYLGAIAFLLAVAACGTGITATWHGHALRTILETGLVAALSVLGIGLVTAAFTGVRAGGTITWAVLTCVLLAGASLVPPSVGTHWGNVTWRPATAAQVRPHYDLGTGEAELDLTGLAPPHGATTATSVSVGAGRLEVRVPRNATVRLTAHVGVGDLRIGDGPHKVRVAPDQNRSVTLAPPSGTASGGTVALDLRLGTGELEVLRDQS